MRDRVQRVVPLGLGPLVVTLLLQRVGVAPLREALQGAAWPALALALAAYGGTIVLRCWRWQALLEAQGIGVSLRRLIALDLMSACLNLTLPGSVTGDVAKYVALTQNEASAYRDGGARVASSLVADRLCGLLTMLWIGVAALPLVGSPLALPNRALLFASAVGGALGLWLLFRPRWRCAVAMRVPRLAPSLATLDSYRSPLVWRAVVAALAFCAMMVVVNGALGHAFGTPLPVALLLAVVPLITLTQVIPLAPNGVGVREGAYLYFLGQFDVAPAVALSMGLAYYGLMVAVGLLGGLLILLTSVRTLRRNRLAPISKSPLPTTLN